MKTTHKINSILLGILILSICLCTGIAGTMAFAAEGGTRSITAEIAGESKVLTYDSSLSGIDYYVDDISTYAFRGDKLVGIESPKQATSKMSAVDDQDSLANIAKNAAETFVDLQAYELVKQTVFAGNIHEFVWAVCVNGIETQDKVIVNISEDGEVYDILFPTYGLAKNLQSSRSVVSVDESDACDLFRNTATNIYSSKNDIQVDISSAELIYNLDNTLVWRIIGGVTYSSNSEVRISEYLQIEINALNGDLETVLNG